MAQYLIKITHPHVKKNILAVYPLVKIIELKPSLLLIESKDYSNINFKRFFGIEHYLSAFVFERSEDDFDLLFDYVKKNICNSLPQNLSFRVTASRHDKNYKFTSFEINQKLGELIHNQTHAKGSMADFDKEFCVDVFSKILIFSWNKVDCFLGLPVGINGSAYLDVTSKNYILKGLLMMYRGISLIMKSPNKEEYFLLNYFHTGREIMFVDEIKTKITINDEFLNPLGLRTIEEQNILLNLFKEVVLNENIC